MSGPARPADVTDDGATFEAAHLDGRAVVIAWRTASGQAVTMRAAPERLSIDDRQGQPLTLRDDPPVDAPPPTLSFAVRGAASPQVRAALRAALAAAQLQAGEA